MTTKTEATESTTESAPAATEQTKKTTTTKAKTTKAAEDAAIAAEDAAKAVEEAKATETGQANESVKTEEVPVLAEPEVKAAEAKQVEVVNPVEVKDSLTLEITNNGPRSYEVFTKTPLPAGETVTIVCSNKRQHFMVKSKFNQLNALAKFERYTVKEV